MNVEVFNCILSIVFSYSIFPIQSKLKSQDWVENRFIYLFRHNLLAETNPSCQVTLRVSFTWEIISSLRWGYIVLLLLSASGLAFRVWRLGFLGWWISGGELPPSSASQMQCMALGRLHWWSQQFQQLIQSLLGSWLALWCFTVFIHT